MSSTYDGYDPVCPLECVLFCNMSPEKLHLLPDSCSILKANASCHRLRAQLQKSPSLRPPAGPQRWPHFVCYQSLLTGLMGLISVPIIQTVVRLSGLIYLPICRTNTLVFFVCLFVCHASVYSSWTAAASPQSSLWSFTVMVALWYQMLHMMHE